MDGDRLIRMHTDGLTARFGGKPAIRDVSLLLPSNTVTAVIGPSGCGKSTFLRCLNRMHELSPHATTTGQVVLDGEDIFDMDVVELRKRVGMVFQKPTPFPTKSIYDNVAAGLTVNGRRPRGELDQTVERALRAAALWDEVAERLRDSPIALSGGQQQRLCIARAVAPGPDVILLDEPTSALDPISTQRIEDLIQDLKRDYTVVVVTHNMQQASRISDYTAFFYLGELVEFGATELIFTKPKNERTEAYVTGRFG